jgi:hypothetical protein
MIQLAGFLVDEGIPVLLPFNVQLQLRISLLCESFSDRVL